MLPKPTEKDKEAILYHDFKVRTRKGVIITPCRVQGRLNDFPTLVIPSEDFGHVTREVSWATLFHCMTNDKPILL